jgi:hypothetical protein
MAYRVQRVSPSALEATERCPRFKPDGRDNAASIDGTLMHEFAEAMVSVPKADRATWIASQMASLEMKAMLGQIADALVALAPEDLPVFTNFRLRPIRGKPRKSPLKPGFYPECEIDRGGGRHGYADLIIVTAEGLVYIVDYKSVRLEHDFSLQLGAYACDVNRLAPAHTHFVCRIIAPRLGDDAQQELVIGPDELKAFNDRIARIEERADWSANDDSIPGVPSDSCQYCHFSGRCKYQANAMMTVADTCTTDLTTVSPKKQQVTVVQALRSLVGPNGPYAGEVVDSTTFLNPATPRQRGLRRACLKFLEVAIDKAKEQDAKWVADVPADKLKTIVPGYSISYVRGRASMKEDQAGEAEDTLAARFRLTPEERASVSRVDKNRLIGLLVSAHGMSEKKANEEIDKCLEPYMVRGAPSVRWTPKLARTEEL